MTLAYRHRRLRFTSVYWAEPRMFTMGPHLVLFLRGYNVTAPRPRRPRIRRVALRRGVVHVARLRASRLGRMVWF